MLKVIDYLDSIAHHPFVMMVGGALVYFLIKYRAWLKPEKEGESFLKDQYDEILWAIMFGMAFVIFDEELLLAFIVVSEEIFNRPIVSIDPNEGFKDAYYLLAAPLFELIIELIGKFKKKNKEA